VLAKPPGGFCRRERGKGRGGQKRRALNRVELVGRPARDVNRPAGPSSGWAVVRLGRRPARTAFAAPRFNAREWTGAAGKGTDILLACGLIETGGGRSGRRDDGARPWAAAMLIPLKVLTHPRDLGCQLTTNTRRTILPNTGL